MAFSTAAAGQLGLNRGEAATTIPYQTQKPKHPEEPKQPQYTSEEIRDWISTDERFARKLVCLIMGSDGTGKSPMAFAALSKQDIKDGYRALILDLDGGCLPLLTQNAKMCEDLGRKVEDVFWVRNPLVFENNDEGIVTINYIKTFDRIRSVVQELLKPVSETDKTLFLRKHKIKVFIFDGLSTALKYAESQMRLDKFIATDGGVSTRFWMIRNKLFLETLEIMKSLPVDVFFIAHDDFDIDSVEKTAKVKEHTNRMCHQKIMCKKFIQGKETRFEAQILKSKNDIKLEGKSFVFARVNSETGNYDWDPAKVLEKL